MPILFIHGSGSSGESWYYQTRAFPDSHAPSLPGHPDGEVLTTVADCAAWAKSYADEHDMEPLIIAGHSLGGAVALQFALDYPDRVKALIIVGSGAKLRVLPKILDDLQAQCEAPGSVESRYNLDGYEKIDPEVAKIVAQRRAENGPVPRLADLRACDEFDVISRLGEISHPTLCICGTEDVMTPPKYTEFLVKGMPNASSLVLRGATHQVHLEQPEPVNLAMRKFLDKLDAA
jgi:pimeloyl-ACP methyl ester carboxylesterase